MLKIRRVVSLICGTETQEKGIIHFKKTKNKNPISSENLVRVVIREIGGLVLRCFNPLKIGV